MTTKSLTERSKKTVVHQCQICLSLMIKKSRKRITSMLKVKVRSHLARILDKLLKSSKLKREKKETKEMKSLRKS